MKAWLKDVFSFNPDEVERTNSRLRQPSSQISFRQQKPVPRKEPPKPKQPPIPPRKPPQKLQQQRKPASTTSFTGKKFQESSELFSYESRPSEESPPSSFDNSAGVGDKCSACECADKFPEKEGDLWDMQFCRWWGYKWLRKREEDIRQQLVGEIRREMKKEMAQHEKQIVQKEKQLYKERLDRNRSSSITNRSSVLESVTNKLFKNKLSPDVKKQLQQKLATPCASATFNNCYCDDKKIRERCTSAAVLQQETNKKVCKEKAMQIEPWVLKEKESEDSSCFCVTDNKKTSADNVQYLTLRMNYIQSEDVCSDCLVESEEPDEIEEQIIPKKIEEVTAPPPIVTVDREIQYELTFNDQLTQTTHKEMFDVNVQTIKENLTNNTTQTIPPMTNDFCVQEKLPEIPSCVCDDQKKDSFDKNEINYYITVDRNRAKNKLKCTKDKSCPKPTCPLKPEVPICGNPEKCSKCHKHTFAANYMFPCYENQNRFQCKTNLFGMDETQDIFKIAANSAFRKWSETGNRKLLDALIKAMDTTETSFVKFGPTMRNRTCVESFLLDKKLNQIESKTVGIQYSNSNLKVEQNFGRNPLVEELRSLRFVPSSSKNPFISDTNLFPYYTTQTETSKKRIKNSNAVKRALSPQLLTLMKNDNLLTYKKAEENRPNLHRQNFENIPIRSPRNDRNMQKQTAVSVTGLFSASSSYKSEPSKVLKTNTVSKNPFLGKATQDTQTQFGKFLSISSVQTDVFRAFVGVDAQTSIYSKTENVQCSTSFLGGLSSNENQISKKKGLFSKICVSLSKKDGSSSKCDQILSTSKVGKVTKEKLKRKK